MQAYVYIVAALIGGGAALSVALLNNNAAKDREFENWRRGRLIELFVPIVERLAELTDHVRRDTMMPDDVRSGIVALQRHEAELLLLSDEAVVDTFRDTLQDLQIRVHELESYIQGDFAAKIDLISNAFPFAIGRLTGIVRAVLAPKPRLYRRLHARIVTKLSREQEQT